MLVKKHSIYSLIITENASGLRDVSRSDVYTMQMSYTVSLQRPPILSVDAVCSAITL